MELNIKDQMSDNPDENLTIEEQLRGWKNRALAAEKVLISVFKDDSFAPNLSPDDLVNLLYGLTDSYGVVLLLAGGPNGIKLMSGCPEQIGAETNDISLLVNEIQKLVSDEVAKRFKQVAYTRIAVDGTKTELPISDSKDSSNLS